MRPLVKKNLFIAAAASSGLLTIVGYPAIKSVYPIKKKTTIVDDYVDLQTATADLTKDIIVPEGIGAGTDVPVDVSHWHLLSLLKSNNVKRRERALEELARQRRWNDAECLEIAQALDRQNTIKLARTADADIRLFLPAPSMEVIEKTLRSNKIEKLVKIILKDVAENSDSVCSSCTNFYTNLSIRVRPDSNILAMSELNQVDKMMRIESRKRKKTDYNATVIRLKAILNNVICGESQAIQMAKSGLLLALLYYRYKYPNDLQVNSLLSQILANLALNKSTKEYLFTDGWIQILTEYTRSEHLELSMPAFKALANMDDEEIKVNGIYGNHIYLLSPLFRNEEKESNLDVIFVHGLVGSVFKSWRQGSIALDEHGNRIDSNNITPTTELLPGNPPESFPDETNGNIQNGRNSMITLETTSKPKNTQCWPKDWLPEDVSGLRIMAVDYPTALSNWRTDCDLNKDTLEERAIHVMKQLELANVGKRPIIWIAHSMGGLLVKQILVLCDEAMKKGEIKTIGKNDDCNPVQVSKFKENLLKQTKGLVFYSVPHKGSNLDWIERKNLQTLLMLTTEVIELQKGSPVLLNLHEKFLKLFEQDNGRDIKILTYAEDSISSFGVNKVVQWKGVLVHEDSLLFEFGPNYKLKIDHAHTCKPNSKNDLTYSRTLEFIRDLVPKNTEHQREGERLMPFISFIM